MSNDCQYKYGVEEQYIDFNKGDVDLDTIRVFLPKAPAYHLIDGYGLSPDEQIFTRTEIPQKLEELEKSCSSIDEIWETIRNNYRYYKKEVEFIRKCWYHRLHGYWFFNNGIPTYIDGWHYFALNFWKYDVGYPEYRDRDRLFYLFARYTYTDTKTFKNLDKDGVAIQNSDGTYDMVDFKRRLCYGFNYPKMRREGATYRAELINYEIISRTLKANGGIQSKDEDSAADAFEVKMMQPFKELPFFFKPEIENILNKNMLKFAPSAKKLAKQNSYYRETGLSSRINYKSATVKAYDGEKLYFKHDDEEGKTKDVDIYKRWNISSNCLSTGNGKNIFGFTISTSTVGDMDADGGARYYQLCKNSRWANRNKNGQTVTGKYNLFIPSYVGLEGFVDKHGNSIINTPTPEQAEYAKTDIGAKEYLENRRNARRLAEDFDGLNEEIRMYPLTFSECFMPSSKKSGFNIDAIQTRIGILRNHINGNIHKRRGDFVRVDPSDPESDVKFVDNIETGKFYISHLLTDLEANKRHREFINDKYEWVPDNTDKYILGCDPFMYNKTNNNRKSNGGGAVFMRRDKRIDNDAKPIQEWQTYKFVCTYSNRTFDKNTYLEDMAMCAQYYGCCAFPENNVPVVEDYFEEHGYSQYLAFEFDYKLGKWKTRAGVNAGEATKQKLFSNMMTYTNKHSVRENHDELLAECMSIMGLEKMTDFDLFAAAGWALYYEEEVKDAFLYENRYDDMTLNKQNQQQADFGVVFRMY